MRTIGVDAIRARESVLRAFGPDLYGVGLVALFLDAIFLNVRPKGPKEGVLCAWGFTEQGERVLVGVTWGSASRWGLAVLGHGT